jgi:hypothetical protein
VPLIAALIVLAQAESVATLGPPNTDYTTPRAFPDVVACLKQVPGLGRPRMSRRDGMAWFASATDRARLRPLLVSEQGTQTRVRLWFNVDWLGLTQCAPIPVVPFAPGQERPDH